MVSHHLSYEEKLGRILVISKKQMVSADRIQNGDRKNKMESEDMDVTHPEHTSAIWNKDICIRYNEAQQADQTSLLVQEKGEKKTIYFDGILKIQVRFAFS